jgi:putative FmdB family regulatory protein
MPLYVYRCPQGTRFERFLHLADYEEPQPCDCCGQLAVRQVVAPFIAADTVGYTSPVDGRWVEGKAARREDLRRNGCVAWEVGMGEEIDRRREREERKFEREVEDTVMGKIASLPARKKEQLQAEEASMDLVLTRNSPQEGV